MKRIKLGIDLRVLPADGSEGAGIPHAARELWHALLMKAEDFDVEIMGFVLRGAKLDTHDRIIYLPSGRGAALNRASREAGIQDMLFPSGSVPIGFRGKAFPWAHDLLIFDHPEWFNQSFFRRLFTTSAFLHGLKKAEHVFSVSRFTKRDIVKHARVPPERITVTYQGCRMCGDTAPESHRRTSQYFLVLGTIEPRKNLELLFDLMREGRFPDHYKLVLAGKTGWGNVFVPDHPMIEFLGEVAEAEKRALLEGAAALLLPSFAEGFGRTALEAMSVGTPVIASREGAVPEVVGDAGILLDPRHEGGWEIAMKKVAENKGLRKELGEMGMLQSSQFSWEKTATRILATIKKTC